MPDSFSIIVIPDTQRYSPSYEVRLTTMTQWIKDNAAAMNIAFVVQVGDIVDHNADAEWASFNTSISILDGFVPYVMCPGNHDTAKIEVPPGGMRDTTKYEAIFPPSRYSGESWWGGYDPDRINSRYVLFTQFGLDFMIIALEFQPNDSMVAWAAGIVESYPNRRIIFITHSYLKNNNIYFNSPGWGGDGNDGQQLWDEFVKLHDNIFLVIGGHEWNGDGIGRLTSLNDFNHSIQQICYGHVGSDGLPPENGWATIDGWMRILTFIPRDNKIEVRTYSPWLDEWETDEQNSFDWPYRMTANIPTNVLLQKNKVSTASAWLVLLEITLTDDTVYRLVQNNEDIVFGGQNYTAFNFQLDPSTQSNSGEIPTITLSVSNITRLIEAKLQELDGGIGSTVKIMVVNSELLSEDFSELEMTYDVLTCHATAKEVVFILGAPSPLRQRFPVDKYLALHCAWAFRSVECGYDGSSGVTCDRTLAACRDYGNSERFGGFPSMRSGSVQVVR